VRSNRSMPSSTVIPELVYPDVGAAVEWLCEAFGFTVRWRAGDHRAQLAVGDGAIVVLEPGAAGGADVFGPTAGVGTSHSIMVRVEDVDAHHARARERGARVLRPPADYPYGERQYTAVDVAGHRWAFSQSIADVPPEAWGGVSAADDGGAG
jgi:uncharacterized glyoxalase superfamily protein PhnB